MGIQLTEKDILALREYAGLSNDEVGEVITLMLNLLEGYESYISNNLSDILKKELCSQLIWFKSNTEIIEHTETSRSTWKELEFK